MKNDAIRQSINRLKTARFTIMWAVAVLTFLVFDIVWCSLTTFRSMSFPATYLYAIGAGTLFSLPSAFWPRRLWIQVTVLILLDCLLVSNLMYFRTYFTAIPAASYLLAGNLAEFKSSVTDSINWWTDIIFFLITTAGTVIASRRKPEPVGAPLYFNGLGVMALLCGVVTIPYGGPINHIRKLTQMCYYINCPPAVYTVFGKIAADISANNETLNKETEAEVNYWMVQNDSIHASYPMANRLGGVKVSNLVIIYLESFENWPIGKTVEGQEITPVINSLITDSTTLYIPRVLSQAGNGRSIDAQLMMLAGMYPMLNEVYSMTHADNEYHTIHKAMKYAEPSTRIYILTGDKRGTWNQIKVAESFGVDTLLDASAWEKTETVGNPPKLSDNALFSQAVEKMRRGEIWPEGEPALVHVIGYSSHNPFRIPEDKRHITLKNEYPERIAEYITAVNYVDHALATLIDYIRSRSDSDRTMIVIMGDHEGLGNYRRNALSHPATAGILQSEGMIPVIVLNSPVSGRIDAVAGQVDIYSTLLDLMELRGYGHEGMGQSVLDPSRIPAAVDPAGKIVADSIVPPAIERRLTDARRVSDAIIKFDMLRGMTK